MFVSKRFYILIIFLVISVSAASAFEIASLQEAIEDMIDVINNAVEKIKRK